MQIKHLCLNACTGFQQWGLHGAAYEDPEKEIKEAKKFWRPGLEHLCPRGFNPGDA